MELNVGMWWLLKVSAQASFLVVVVLLIQMMMGRRLSARARYALWFLVLAKLLLPASPSSALSIFNFARWPIAAQVSRVESVNESQPSPSYVAVESPRGENVARDAAVSAPSGAVAPAPSVQTTAERVSIGKSIFDHSGGILTVIWALGVVFLLLRILVQNARFAVALRGAIPIHDPATLELLGECKRILGVRSQPLVCETSAVKSPALYGIIRPQLLLPPGILTEFSRDELKHIFLHELAHIRRYDMPVHWLTTLLNVLHWFNPVLWLAFRRMAADRELACDELALSLGAEEEPARYGATIIRLLESSSEPSALPGVLGIMENKNQMVQRIARIANFKRRTAWSLTAMALLAALSVATLTDAQSPKTDNDKTAAVTNALAPTHMLFRVVDATTGEPVPGVTVEVQKTNLITDATGTVQAPLPAHRAGDFYYRIKISKDGYVAKYVSWSKYQKDLITDIPTEYTARMEKGITIGGRVQNPAGRGIANVKITFSGPSPSGISDRERPTIMGNFHTEWTDAEGRWRCSHVPSRFESFTYRLTHSDYVTTDFSTENSGYTEPTRLPSESYRATNAIMTMAPGIKIAGKIVDTNGQPVPDTILTQNHDWDNPTASVTNLNDGSFVIRNARPGELTVTIQARRFAPQTLNLNVTNPMPEVVVEMKPGHTVRGRVVGEDGQAIEGAEVTFARVNFRPAVFDWSTKTDANGYFLWDSAPEGTHTYTIYKSGFLPLHNHSLTSDGKEHLVQMKKWVGEKPYVFKGAVSDKADGRPITNFSLHLKEYSGGSGYSPFQREFASSAGQFSLRLDPKANYDVEVRARGYSPEVSKLRSNEDGEDREIDFALKKSLGLSGRVRLPDGQPVKGAEVALSTREHAVILGKRALMYREQGITTDSAEDGSFSFRPVADAQKVYAVHEKGFAEVDLLSPEASLNITLLPWGRVEGTMYVRGLPVAGQEVGILEAYWNPYSRGFSFNPGPWKAITDANGNFVFEDVPPMDVRIHRMINRTYRYPMYVEVKPGETTRIRHAPEGRRLNGKLLVPEPQSMDWHGGSHRLDLSRKMPELPSPKTKDPEAQKNWANQFWRSAEGKAHQKAARYYGLQVAKDGTFHVDDVPPGDYELRIELREKSERSVSLGRVIGRLTKPITVPQAAGGNFGEIDIGNFEVEMAKVLNVGDLAPEFEIKTVDGETLTLSDYRGKHVLLDFWATWCGPCIGEIPNLKQVHARFAKDNRFAMIGLSLDKNVRAPKEYTQTNTMLWTQGFLGEWAASKVPGQYGVEGIPATFLIGPDGRIQAANLRGPEMLRAVTEALEKK